MFLPTLALVAVGGFMFKTVVESANAKNPTEVRLQQEIANMLNGKTASVASKHILGDYRAKFKKNPELFSFSKPERLYIKETQEFVWSVTLKTWSRARDRNDDFAHPTYQEAALFYNTPKGTIKPYIY